MGFKLQYFGLIFVVFIINSYNTFATWHDPPTEYLPSKRLCCEEWLAAYNYCDSTEHNRKEALARNRKFDTHVYYHAAIYAQLLCSFHFNESFSPSQYCEMYDIIGRRYFDKITDLKRGCTEWLRTYGFKVDVEVREIEGGILETIQPETVNWRRSQNRNKLEDNYIYIWPALFARLLEGVPEEESISVADFCNGMGQKNSTRYWLFMTIDTMMKCQDWIEFAGYTDDLNENLTVLSQTLAMKFNKLTNTWAQRYGDHLHVESAGVPLPSAPTPYLLNDKFYEYINNTTAWLTPMQFCFKNETNPQNYDLYSYYN